jgi:peroxiredoxin
MKTRVLVLIFALAAATATVPSGVRAEGGAMSGDINALLSRLQAMGHGYHTEAEWNELFRHMDELTAQAKRAGESDSLVEITVIRAMVYSDMLGQHRQALNILEDTKREFGPRGLPSLRRAYVTEAKVYAALGDEAAIGALIGEFKRSSLYDPQRYGYSAGEGRDTPLTIVRPGARGGNSTTVTAMEKYRTQARFAPGRVFPDFELRDRGGARRNLSDYRGKVVLVDFWMPGWTPWQRELPGLAQAYRKYQSYGFEIVGVNLSAGGASDEFLRANRMTWPQATADATVTKRLGIFGEVTSFLLDKDGMIVGRDLRGADLVQAIRRSLGLQ